MMKQVGLLSAGCQPWNSDVCAASGDRFAYCATLAIYIYKLDHHYNEFKLEAIMSEHKKTITAISWNPTDPDVFASTGADNQVVIWNITKQKAVASLANTNAVPNSVGWVLNDKETVVYVSGRGPLYIWNYRTNGSITNHKDTHNFISDVTKFRLHYKQIGRMVFGHADGSLSFFNTDRRPNKHVLRPENVDGSEDDDPVMDLEWDPLSLDYLLVVHVQCGVRLVDCESLNVITVFQLPNSATAVQTLAWIPTAPGMFATGDTHHGIIRFWTVSNPAPICSLNLKKTGFHCLRIFSASSQEDADGASGVPGFISSTSKAVETPTPADSSTSYMLPPGHAICTFLDGGVGLYNFAKRSWDFLRDMGHVETIFECQFKPDNADYLATASFDGTIKVWDVNTMTCALASHGNEGVIYSISWAPADLNCVAASTSKNGSFIWDMDKNKVIHRYQEHKGSVFCVAWNQKDSRRIATCGSDGYCIIRNVDGSSLQKYKHPSCVFGCDWSTNNKDMIATGSEDGKVRVYYTPTTSSQPLKVFSGHTAKVFRVKWSPLREGILCSGSDDGTIRVWDYTQDACVNVLNGHTAPVRGLLWNQEVPYLLISGSWDYSIRVWDTRDGACIDIALDHGADVYGLTSHYSRPMTLASCSRDSTVRIWSLSPLVTSVHMKIIARRPWKEIINSPEHSMTVGCEPLLSGRLTREIKARIDKFRENVDYDVILRWFSPLFMIPNGCQNLWELVSIVNGQDDSLLSGNYNKGILHTKHLLKFRASDAQQLQLAKISQYRRQGGSKSCEEKLREAALIHMKLGNVTTYCELMIELDEWEKALSIAPSVSMDYWNSLAQRRAERLCREDNDECIPYFIATNSLQPLVEYFGKHGQLKDAVCIAQAAVEGAFQDISRHDTHERLPSKHNGLDCPSEEHTRMLNDAVDKLALWYFQDGCPIHSACCHLSIGDIKKCLSKLMRGNELELVVSIGSALKSPEAAQFVNIAIRLLARRCERLNKWELGIDLLKTIRENELDLIKLCARYSGSASEVNDLHLQVTTFINIFIYFKLIENDLKKPGIPFNSISQLVDLLGCIRTCKLKKIKNTQLRAELLIISAYVGALKAIQNEYQDVVIPLFQHARNLMAINSVNIGVSDEQLLSEITAVTLHSTTKQFNKKNMKIHTASVKIQDEYQTLLDRVGQSESPVEPGADLVTGSQFPSHSDVHISILTDKRIQGASFFLEDGVSAVSINEALMWAKCNSFSPSATGDIINPF
ncbi:WD repeat-containing protein 17-like [Anneissia japonica]|uniref:WD repeat-containing protein 17-like n=1 Tax=Anneissia japonica TaxID=1529436 RepID=UPI001425A78F|nr:WD repeat-containing protein 17-like [Anneissia japonica]